MTVWDFTAHLYHFREKIWPFSRILSSELSNLQLLVNHVDFYGARILDVATGTGAALNLFPEDSNITAVDNSPHMLSEARRRRPGVTFVIADVGSLPFHAASFDVVTAIGIFEYQYDQSWFLTNLKRMTKPAGHIVFTFAQKNIFNLLRILSGHYVRSTSLAAVSAMVERSGLIVRQKKESLMQTQILVSIN